MTVSKLDQKYRARTFSELVGQKAPARFLSRMVAKGEVRNVIHVGSTGCGKTSAARLYGRGLNCEMPRDGGEPCNGCENCLAQLEGAFPDYLEHNVGTEGGKADIAQLVELARTPPLRGAYRVIVLDEAQNLTAAAQETLKKLVEEPPPFTVIVFTTTDLKQIIRDIQSRCAILHFSRIGPDVAVPYLQYVCDMEDLPYEVPALQLIAHLAEGELRPLMTRLDQLRLFGEVTLADARQIFNLDFLEHLPQLWLTLLTGSLPETLGALARWDEDPERVADLSRAFVLWLQCRAAGESVLVNPLFASAPPGVLAQIQSALEQIGMQAGLTVEEVCAHIGRGLGMNTTSSRPLLQLLLRDVYNVVKVFQFDTGKAAPGGKMQTGSAASATPAAGTAGPNRIKGRRFVEGYQTNSRGVASLPAGTPELPTPVRPMPAYVAPAFNLAPPIGAPGGPMPFAPPPGVTPLPFGTPPPAQQPAARPPEPVAPQPIAEVTLADDAPPPSVPAPEEEDRLPPGSTGGAFEFKMPVLAPRKPVYAHDLTQGGWREGGGPIAVHRRPGES